MKCPKCQGNARFDDSYPVGDFGTTGISVFKCNNCGNEFDVYEGKPMASPQVFPRDSGQLEGEGAER